MRSLTCKTEHEARVNAQRRGVSVTAARGRNGGRHRRAARRLRAVALRRARRRDRPGRGGRSRERRPRHVVFTARGTSDHAALYGAYLTEIRLGLPAGLASPSAVTVFGARPDLSDALVVGVSQSGGSPDLAEVLRAARASGALTLAVTNNPDSPLAGDRRAARRHRRRARAGGRRHQDVHRRTARPAAAGRGRPGRRRRAAGRGAGRAGRAARAGRPHPGRPHPGPARPALPVRRASWSPPAGGTPTRPPGRRR